MPSAPPAKVPAHKVWHIVNAPLKDRGRVLWIWYRRHHIDERGAFVSDDATAARLGWSRRKVQYARADLIRAGYLIAVPRGPGPQAYYPTLPELETHTAAPQESQPDASQPSQGSQDAAHKPARPPKEEPVEPGKTTGRTAAPLERRAMRPDEEAAAAEFARKVQEKRGSAQP